ncbi:Por secretion system C-terminal sorting domain-containing protein [Maribacter sedimenticola]|uniref:Por secretion system C-terminal sorting domain-containing protein n=1 Tax=Maribacter sedimenticola TaxID=228956 RepID=A0ABY1SDG2_9FLAO|nr:thrombospondin type 3 repeat-containing protein [Maribacter sedimenticola]SNR28624.1 Por secretion system C-terminal sorting domain-containing protein [Maribacter sedimenticola]
MSKNYTKLLFAVFILFSFQLSSQGTAASDREALIAFYNSTDGDNWTISWDLSAPTDSWYGVTTDANGRVTNILIQSNGLVGTLPDELGNLSELQSLELHRNFYIGYIPNILNGSIPSTFQNLKKLEILNLFATGISGTIPNEIGQMTALKELWLSSNELTGELPTTLGDLSDLELLLIGSNKLTGNIPAQLGQLSNLKRLSLINNELTGNIPSDLGLLTNLTELNLGWNDLTGNIPDTFGQLVNLKILYLSINKLSGPIPSTLGNLSLLENLEMGQNSLTGTIPNSLGQLSNLTRLILRTNNLEGGIPSEIGQLTNLEEILLSGNNLTGTIPVQLGNLSNLTKLHLHDNQLSGNIPEELGNLTNMADLNLYKNLLEGSIPVSLSQLNNLTSLSFSSNNLNGNIPIFSKDNIQVLSFTNNNFIFEDLFNTLGNQANAIYYPQLNIDEPATIDTETGEVFTISVTATTDSNNNYQWRKDGEDIDGATSSTFTITSVSSADIGSYDCLISNSALPELILNKNPILLTVDGASIIDTDNDGIADSNDECPNTPPGESVNFTGCSSSQLDDDNDGVTNNLDVCRNTPVGEPVDEKGCIIIPPNQTNYLQNFSFENWSGTPNAPDNWSIVNATSFSQANFYHATEGRFALRLDLSTSISERTELSTRNVSKVSLQKNKAHTFAFDYKVYVGTGESITATLWILKDNGNYATQYIAESLSLNTDGEWHTYSYDFTTDTEDEDYVFELEFRATSAPQSIIVVDYMRVLGETPPDEDNDGVTDAIDQCPNTSPNALAVDDNGCEVAIDNSSIIEDPSFEDWSIGGGSNLAKWGINLIPGSSWNKNEDISDNLEYSLELTTGDNGSNASSIFQNDIQLYKGVEYEISIDYKVIQGSFNILQFELSRGIFAESVHKVTTDPFDDGWRTFKVYYTAESNEIVDLNIRAVSDQPQDHILLDNMVLRANIASTDDDNDGVENTIDQCPNTPAGETVNSNGCSQSQLDDDNDGVFNDNDTCPNTPQGSFVDNNGCPVTQTDTDEDEDGVFDADDICPNTPAGQTVNSNGCAQSQLDDDNDGVNNAVDQCPNTPMNATVNSVGCTSSESSLPNIPNNGIQVKVTSTSCPNTANGEITVNFSQDYNYTVKFIGGSLNTTYTNIDSSEDLIQSDLTAGIYSVCVSIPEYPAFEQCFSVTVGVPEDFTTGKTVIDYHTQKARIIVSGSKNYEVLVNDKLYTYQFNDLSNQELSFPLDKGINHISIETDKICQGTFSEHLIINKAILSPNPVAETLRVEGLDTMNNAQVLIANLNGVTALHTTSVISNGIFSMDISNLDPGVYMLTILENEKEINLKFVKK